jgi:hypothetical protein
MEAKNCQNCKKEFVIEVDDKSFYEKMSVPTPTFCPECRMIRRLVFRNERKLFKVNNAFTGEIIFSLYPEQANRKIITQEEWFSDSWDPRDYAREYDFSRPFFEQLFDLDTEVPIYGLNVTGMIRSEYCANASYLKDCYLIFNSNNTENSLYGNSVDRCRDCLDNSHISDSERCHECFWVQNCYQCYHTIMCVDSRNMWFSRDCLGCSDCFGCTNLRKASYCIFNQQYSKEEYFSKLKEMNLNTRSGIEEARKACREFWKTQPNKYHQGLMNLNSTGAYVSHCKNVLDSYLVRNSEDMRYCQYMLVPGNKNCMDVSVWGQNTENSYETSVSGENSYNLKFTLDCWPNVRDCEYSMHLKSSSDCFGCVGLKSAQYCILNKQYSKEEYFEMVDKIKKHMDEMPYVDKNGNIYKYGEFFPVEMCPFGYNNTAAQDQVCITKELSESCGYPWVNVERGEYKITINGNELPDTIDEVDDSITKEVVGCAKCGHAYRIVVDELSFLKKSLLPLPNMCYECRHERRIIDRLKNKLYDRNCYKCNIAISTPFPPEQNDIVYCEKCYQAEVV